MEYVEYVSPEFTADAFKVRHDNTLLSRAIFCMSFILKTNHDTVSMLHSVEEDPSRSWFLWSRSPLGLGGLMKSDPSFIKIQGWGLVIKKKRKRRENKKQALVN